MGYLKFFNGFLFRNRTFCFITLLALVLTQAHSLGHAATPPQQHSVNEISSLLTKIKKDAEDQIAAIHGISKLVSLKNGLVQEYHLNEMPLPQKGDSCPALGFTADDIGTIIEAKALNRAGIYYAVAVEAMLKGYPEIAKWGFANASIMSLGCATYISNLAFILNEHDDFKHAAVLLEYAKQLDPTETSIYVNLAFSYQNLHRYDDAITEIMIAVTLHPKLKTYQKMLADLIKLEQEEKKNYVIKNGLAAKGETGLQSQPTPQLDEALGMLEEKKEAEFQNDMNSSLNYPLPYDNRQQRPKKKTWERDDIDLINSFDPSAFEEDDNAVCSYFSQQSHVLVRAGDGMVEKAGFIPPGGNPIEKFIITGGNHINKSKEIVKKIDNKSYKNRLEVVKDFASLGALEAANVFYGVAGEMYEMCGEVNLWPEGDKLLDDVIKENIKWEKEFWENLDKEKFSKQVCSFNKICVSKGDQGSIRISVKDSWITTKIQLHPTNLYKYQLKVYTGPKIFEKTIGSVLSGELSVISYFEWKFGRGITEGIALKGAGLLGKNTAIKDEKEISLISHSFENSPGSTKPP